MRTLTRLVILVSLLAACIELPAFAATQDVNITWTAPTVNPTAVVTYKVERKAVSGGTYTSIANTASTVLTFTDVSQAQGTTPCYRVTSVGAVGSSAPTPDACINTAGVPGAPGAVSLTITIRP